MQDDVNQLSSTMVLRFGHLEESQSKKQQNGRFRWHPISRRHSRIRHLEEDIPHLNFTLPPPWDGIFARSNRFAQGTSSTDPLDEGLENSGWHICCPKSLTSMALLPDLDTLNEVPAQHEAPLGADLEFNNWSVRGINLYAPSRGAKNMI